MALGIREPPPSSPSVMKESLSSEPLRRLVGMTPSRSRDLLASFQQHHGMVTGPGGERQSLSGRTSPASALLHRIAVEKDESLLRKEILSRSLIGRDLLSRESLKDDLLGDEKSEKIASRLGAVVAGGVGLSSGGMGAGVVGGPAAAALLAGRLSGAKPVSSYAHLGGIGATPPSGPGVGVPSAGGGPGGMVSSTPSSSVAGDSSRLKLLTINPSEFLRYKI